MTLTYKDLHENHLRYMHIGFQLNIHTPYSLINGIEAVQPIKVEIPSLRVLMEVEIGEVERIRTSYD